MDKKMSKTHYGCSGSCRGEITEEQFNAGQKTCNDQDCDCYGEPLKKMEYCSSCEKHYMPESADNHRNCG